MAVKGALFRLKCKTFDSRWHWLAPGIEFNALLSVAVQSGIKDVLGALNSTKISIYNFGNSTSVTERWNGTFGWHTPDSSRCAFCFCTCEQDSFWGQ